jgi:hypothetical protein
VPLDPSLKRIWQPNLVAGYSDPVFQTAMKKYFDMADDDKNGTAARACHITAISHAFRAHLSRRIHFFSWTLLSSVVVAPAQGW